MTEDDEEYEEFTYFMGPCTCQHEEEAHGWGECDVIMRVYRCALCGWETTHYSEIDGHEFQVEPGHDVTMKEDDCPCTAGWEE